MSSANANIPTKSFPILIPSSLVSKFFIIYLINKLNSIGEVLPPVLLLSNSQLLIVASDLLCKLLRLDYKFAIIILQYPLVPLLPLIIRICPYTSPNQKLSLCLQTLLHSYGLAFSEFLKLAADC